jgi:junctophilin
LNDSGGGGATANQISNTLSPNKSNLMAASTTSRNQNVNNQIKEQHQNVSAATSHQQQQQHQISNNNQSSRRASVNSMNRQKSMDYAHMNQTSNQQNSSMDMSNTLGQQFGQPQPPGKSPMTTPQKYPPQNNHVQDQSSHYQQQNTDNYQNYSQMSSNDYQQQSQQQQQQQQSSTDYMGSGVYGGGSRRNSSRVMSESGRPMLGSINQAASIDHFDHYKRPPSRDSSVDRYSRAASRLGGGSRQPSIDRQMPSVINSTSNEVPQIDRNNTSTTNSTISKWTSFNWYWFKTRFKSWNTSVSTNETTTRKSNSSTIFDS